MSEKERSAEKIEDGLIALSVASKLFLDKITKISGEISRVEKSLNDSGVCIPFSQKVEGGVLSWDKDPHSKEFRLVFDNGIVKKPLISFSIEVRATQYCNLAKFVVGFADFVSSFCGKLYIPDRTT